MLEDLRTHVEGGSDHGVEELLVIVNRLGKAQIGYLEGVVVHEQVGGLHVAVHDVALTQVVKSLQDLLFQGRTTRKYPTASFSVRYPLLLRKRSRLSPLQYSQRM
jgi:hypothetical protein